MTTLSDLHVTIGGALRDSAHSTFSTTALSDLINQGIDAIADFYPKEIVQDLGTVAANVSTYSASSFSNIYRIDIYSATYALSGGGTGGGLYLGALEHLFGNDADGGWELHGGILYTPPNIALPAGSTVRAFGYGRYIQLSANSSTTDLDSAAIHALKSFCQMEAFALLRSDRMKFQQWQENSNNTDVSLLALAQAESAAVQSWRRQQQRLRRPRKR